MTAHLDGVQGNSPVVAARIRQADADRLTAIAQHFGVPLSRVIRVTLLHGLAHVETAGLPDGGQSVTPDNEGAPAG